MGLVDSFLTEVNSRILKSQIKESKELWLAFGDKLLDKESIRDAIKGMSKVYQAETGRDNSAALISFSRRGVRSTERQLPLGLRFRIGAYFKIVGLPDQRNQDLHSLEEYTYIKEKARTKMDGYYYVPDSYHRKICSVSPETYRSVVSSLTDQLQMMIDAKSTIEGVNLIEGDQDLCLSGKDLKRFTRLHNRIDRTKNALSSSLQKEIDRLQLRIGVYSRFHDISRGKA